MVLQRLEQGLQVKQLLFHGRLKIREMTDSEQLFQNIDIFLGYMFMVLFDWICCFLQYVNISLDKL